MDDREVKGTTVITQICRCKTRKGKAVYRAYFSRLSLFKHLYYRSYIPARLTKRNM